jgi:hypothetical protein
MKSYTIKTCTIFPLSFGLTQLHQIYLLIFDNVFLDKFVILAVPKTKITAQNHDVITTAVLQTAAVGASNNKITQHSSCDTHYD